MDNYKIEEMITKMQKTLSEQSYKQSYSSELLVEIRDEIRQAHGVLQDIKNLLKTMHRWQ